MAAFDRQGLLRDITTLLANAHIDVVAVNTQSNKDDNTAKMNLTVELASLSELANLLMKINRLPNVSGAQRVREGFNA